MAPAVWSQVLHRGPLRLQGGHHPLPVCAAAVSGHQGPEVRGEGEGEGEGREWDVKSVCGVESKG